MNQLPQATGVSYDVLGARRVDFLTKNQLLRMLGMVAEVKHIPRLQKDNEPVSLK